MLSHRIRTFIAAVIYVVFAIPCQAKDPITLMAHSTGPGQWVGHYAEPLNEQDLKPFVGQYLLAGQWPKGVNRPDDPKLLLGRQKLGATRVVAVKVEEGGHLVRLSAGSIWQSNASDSYRRHCGRRLNLALVNGAAPKPGIISGSFSA